MNRGLQRDIDYLCWPLASSYSYTSPNAGDGGGGCGVSANEYSCAHHVTWSPNKLWRSTSLFSLWMWTQLSSAPVVHLALQIFENDAKGINKRPGGRWFMKKSRSKNSRDEVSLNASFYLKHPRPPQAVRAVTCPPQSDESPPGGGGEKGFNQVLLVTLLKGQCHEIFDFRYFLWISSPKPLSIPLEPFQIFCFFGDIRSSRCTTGVVDTGGKWKKSSITKVVIIFLGQILVVKLTYRQKFFPSSLL